MRFYHTPSSIVLLLLLAITASAQVPSITSFSPSSGAVGSTVTISGSNFSTTAANNKVFFGSIKAAVTSAIASQLTVTVPAGAITNNISVLVNGLIAYSPTPFKVTFSNNGVIDATTLASTGVTMSYSAGKLINVGFEDFDGDAKMDLIVVDNEVGKVSVHRNTNTIGSIKPDGFLAPVELTTLANPNLFSTGDLDRDGKMDLVLTSTTASQFSIFQNTSTTGNISFGNRIDIDIGATSSQASVSRVADLDFDGKPDILMINQFYNVISIFRNLSVAGSTLSSSSFDDVVEISSGALTTGFEVVDMNTDKKPDLLATSGAQTISVMLNTSTPGTITIAPFGFSTFKITTDGTPYAVAEDLDDDGNIDIVAANSNSNKISLFERNSGVPLNFGNPIEFSTPGFVFNPDTRDFNGDGKMDVIVSIPNNFSIYRNKFSGAPFNAVNLDTRVDFTTTAQPNVLAPVDIDGDSRCDLAVVEYISNAPRITFWHNNTLAAQPTNSPTLSSFSNVGASRMDLSFTASGGGADGYLVIAKASSSPTFTPVDQTVYSTGADLGSGTFVAYAGSSISSTLLALDPSTNYFFKVFAYNGSGTSINYLTTSSLSASHSTTALPTTTVTSVSPLSGHAGTTVTIIGTNFSTKKTANTIFFGRTKGTIVTATETQLTAIVPSGATLDPISISVGGWVATTKAPFRVTYKSDQKLEPAAFGTPIDFLQAPDAQITDIHVNDFDEDGKLDLAVFNQVTFTFDLYRNTADAFTAIDQNFFHDPTEFGLNFPYSMKTGDIDGDGRSDWLLVAPGDNSITLMKNTSSPGAFASSTQVSLTGANPPTSTTLCDVDNDHKPDIIVADNSNTISIYRNATTLSSFTTAAFGTPFHLTTSSYVTDLNGTDIDGDGKQDIIATIPTASGVTVFKNTGTAGVLDVSTVAAGVTFVTGSSTMPQKTLVTDIDLDGKPDLIVMNGTPAGISILKNTATSGVINASSFAAPINLAVFNGDYYLVDFAIGDLDGDGKPDIVGALDDFQSSLVMFKNTSTPGTISFGPKASFDFGTGIYNIDIGDMNSDSKPEIIYADNNGHFFVLENQMGAPAPISQPSNLLFSKIEPHTMTLTVDAAPDSPDGYLIFANFDHDPQALPKNHHEYQVNEDVVDDNETGTKAVYSGTSVPFELVSLLQSQVHYFAIYSYNGAGDSISYNVIDPLRGTQSTAILPQINSFSPASGPVGSSVTINGFYFSTTASDNIVYFGGMRATVTSATPSKLVVTVPTGATQGPLSVTRAGRTAYTNTVFQPTFNGSHVLDDNSFGPKIDFNPGDGAIDIKLADIDGDSKLDIISLLGNELVTVRRNISTTGSITENSFEAPVSFSPGFGPLAMIVQDIDGDGKLDIAAVNAGDNTSNYADANVAVLRNTSTPGTIDQSSFAPPVSFPTGLGPYELAAGDLDRDGRPDLVVENLTDKTISILWNKTTDHIDFAPKVDLSPGNVGGLAFGDLNFDNMPDIVVGSSTATLSIYQNTSNSIIAADPSFTAKKDVTIPGGVFRTIIADIDGDGQNDMAIADPQAPFTNRVSVIRNSNPTTPVTITPTEFAVTDLTVGGSSTGLILDDLDGDGKRDLISVNGNAGFTVSLLKNIGSPGGLPVNSFASKIDLPRIGNSVPFRGATGDLDGDGRPELVIANISAPEISIYYNGVAATKPDSQPLNFSASNITDVSLTASFTAPFNVPDGYIVLARANNPVADLPVDHNAYSVGTLLGNSFVISRGNTTSFPVTALVPGIQYYFLVCSYNGSGYSISYNTSTALTGSATTLAATPSQQPTAFVASLVTQTGATLSFGAAAGDPSYLILRKTDGDPTFVPAQATVYTIGNTYGDAVVIAAGPSISVNEASLTSGSTYHYAVYAFNGTGATSNYLTASPLLGSLTTIPANPVATNATVNDQHSFTANWNSSTGATSYRLDVSQDDFATFVTGFENLEVTNGTTVSVTGLSTARTYKYRVRSVNTSGVSGSSNIITATTLTETPVALAADNVTQSSAVAKWQSVTGASTFYIDVATDEDFVTLLANYTNLSTGNVTTLTLNGLTAGTTYYYRVRAGDDGGISPSSNSISFKTAGGGSAELQLGNVVFPSSAVSGDVTVTADVSGGNGTRTVLIHYRPILNTSFTELSTTLKTGSTTSYTANIPATAFDALGVEFTVDASDSKGAQINSDSYFIYKSVDVTAAQSIPFAKGFDGSSVTYQMFSVPYKLTDDAISDLFESPLNGFSDTKWRLLHYQNGSLKEYPSQLKKIEAGTGYWFNTIETDFQITIGAATVVPANQQTSFNINLDKGWNQVGNPFTFPITWSKVVNGNDKLGSLWFYGGGSYSKSDTFQPWTGAFVFADDAITNFSIPVTSKSNGREMSAEELSDDPDADEWKLPMKLEINGLETYSGVGMSTQAKMSKDRFDEITVPRFIDYIEFKTYHEEFFAPWFSTDVVPSDDKQEWTFEVSSNIHNNDATLSWEVSTGTRSSLVLVDDEAGKWVDMTKASSYTFRPTTGRQIRILYNRHGKIDIGRTMLGDAYPNPFSAATVIPVIVSKSDLSTTVEIYDMIGRKIRTLDCEFDEEGINEIRWDGADNTGSDVAAGMFLYKLQNSSQAKRIIKN